MNVAEHWHARYMHTCVCDNNVQKGFRRSFLGLSPRWKYYSRPVVLTVRTDVAGVADVNRGCGNSRPPYVTTTVVGPADHKQRVKGPR